MMQCLIKGGKKNQFADIMQEAGGNGRSLLPWSNLPGYNSGQFTALNAVINNIQGMAMIFFWILKVIERTEKKDHLSCPADPEIADCPMEIINPDSSGEMHGIYHLQKSGGKDWIFAKNLDNLSQSILGVLENGFQFVDHRWKRGQPLAMVHELPAFTNPDPRTHDQIMLQRLFKALSQGQTERPVSSTGRNNPYQGISARFLRKNNSDRMGAGNGDLAKKILFVQTRQAEIAQDDIRHDPDKKLFEFFDG